MDLSEQLGPQPIFRRQSRIRSRSIANATFDGHVEGSQSNEARMIHPFEKLTPGCARFAGRPLMLVLCFALALAGLVAFFSGNELFINGANLSISVLTLLLLPILQATQNRDGAALHAKMDELIKASSKARDDLIGLENRGSEDIEDIRVDEGQRAKASGKKAPAPKKAT